MFSLFTFTWVRPVHQKMRLKSFFKDSKIYVDPAGESRGPGEMILVVRDF